MVRITKENEDIDRKKEIETIKQQAKKEVQQVEEIKNSKITELEKELAMLKELYKIKQQEKENKILQQEKEKEQTLQNEIQEIKEKLGKEQIETTVGIDEINENKQEEEEQYSETSETYTELLEQINNTTEIEINTGDIKTEVLFLCLSLFLFLLLVQICCYQILFFYSEYSRSWYSSCVIIFISFSVIFHCIIFCHFYISSSVISFFFIK